MKACFALVAGLLLADVQGATASCTVHEVADELQLRDYKREAELAGQSKKVLRKIEEVSSRAKDPNKSIGDQLSKEDLDEFSQARARYQAIELLTAIESIYGRDIRVIHGIYEAAQDQYFGKPDPNETDPSYSNHAFLALVRLGSEDPEMKPNFEESVSDTSCTMALAIQKVEDEAVSRFDQSKWSSAMSIVNQIKARNGGKLEKNSMGSADRAKMDELERTILGPAQRELEFIKNLEAVKLRALTASIRYETFKKQATDSGGDVKSIVNAFEGADLPPRTKLGLFVLDKISAKVPSEHERMLKEIAPYIEQVKKDDADRLAKAKQKNSR